MDQSSIVNVIDRYQSSAPSAVLCPQHNPEKKKGYHGKLWPNASGTTLHCGNCEVVVGVDSELIADATQYAEDERGGRHRARKSAEQ